jgi:hypothetical protein
MAGMATYLAGSPARIELPRFEDEKQRPYDPALLSVVFWPDREWIVPGEVREYVYGPDTEVVKVSTGVYVVDFTPPRSGVWRYAVRSSEATFDGYFYAKPAPAPPEA